MDEVTIYLSFLFRLVEICPSEHFECDLTASILHVSSSNNSDFFVVICCDKIISISKLLIRRRCCCRCCRHRAAQFTAYFTADLRNSFFSSFVSSVFFSSLWISFSLILSGSLSYLVCSTCVDDYSSSESSTKLLSIVCISKAKRRQRITKSKIEI